MFGIYQIDKKTNKSYLVKQYKNKEDAEKTIEELNGDYRIERC
ncbi:MAG TPA: hypothetical protein PL042_01715 [Caldisericia bacterium]|nr:hypothetical protein [Caldisericia bacterium]